MPQVIKNEARLDSDPTVTEGCQACLVWMPGLAGVQDPAEKEDPISVAAQTVAAAQTLAADLTLAVDLNAAVDPNVAAVLLAVLVQIVAASLYVGEARNVEADLSVAAVLLAGPAQTVVASPYEGVGPNVEAVVAAQSDSDRSAVQIAAPPVVPKVALAVTLLQVTNRQTAEQLMAAKFQFAHVSLSSVYRHRHQVKWVGQFFLAYSHPCL